MISRREKLLLFYAGGKTTAFYGAPTYIYVSGIEAPAANLSGEVSVTIQSAVIEGDLIIMQILGHNAGTANANPIVAPVGWTVLRNMQTLNQANLVCYKIATVNEAGGTSVVVNNNPSPYGNLFAITKAYRGINQVDPLENFSITDLITATSVSLDVTASASNDNSICEMFWGQVNNYVPTEDLGNFTKISAVPTTVYGDARWDIYAQQLNLGDIAGPFTNTIPTAAPQTLFSATLKPIIQAEPSEQPLYQPSYVNRSSAINYGGSGDVNASYPLRTQLGDCVIFFATTTNGGTSDSRGPIQPNNNLVLIENIHDNSHSYAVFYRIIDGTEGSTENFVNTNGGQIYVSSIKFANTGFGGKHLEASLDNYEGTTGNGSYVATKGAKYDNTLSILLLALGDDVAPTSVVPTGYEQKFETISTSAPGTIHYLFTQKIDAGEVAGQVDFTASARRTNCFILNLRGK